MQDEPLRIVIESIPHEQQRYNTPGDWFWDDGTLQIRVSRLSEWKLEFLMAFHELFEAMWCKNEGVSQHDVDRWDTKFELARKDEDTREPGDSLNAPYYTGHQLATGLERIAAAELGVNWQEYEEEVLSLSKEITHEKGVS